MIQLKGVEKTLGGQPVLRGVDLDIPKGDITTIIGPSGEGKSVLLKHIIGLMRPDRGQVLVDGVDLAKIHAQELNEIRKKFAMLFQSAALFDSLNVFDNVAFPLREKRLVSESDIQTYVPEMLERVGLGKMGHKFPAELSGGMKKRAGLARALVMGPEIILFDEPTTGLDPLMAHAIHDLILAMHKAFGFTGIMVSHEIPKIFPISDWVAMLKNGKILAMARSAEFQRLSDPLVREFISVPHAVVTS
ncbi:MAG: ABC transporter ATP-binding protein [Nitrospirales bacterium]|nr:MAG: ABC transporter ATP-binding protein [Nitrospirales bacterium]